MNDLILKLTPLGAPPWPTLDPFLFCVHHDDAYPAGNAELGPAASLEGRAIGSDFAGKDGWRMYHGDVVPGFPQHPHRGFETVTVVRQGLIDHSDSIGATARYGQGDVQWLTAGKGIVHSEMFPLVNSDRDNPAELFQLWLNLPRADKFAEPHFTMMWADHVPKLELRDQAGKVTSVTIVAGAFGETVPPAPPPRSWAARPESGVAIWTLRMEAGAQVTLPPAPQGARRTLYFFRGSTLSVGGQAARVKTAIEVRAEVDTPITNGDEAADILVLQGRPIGEPVVAYGPFVMNTPGEIRDAFAEYQRTQFGGWPWPSDGPVHGTDPGRFAKRKGEIERAPVSSADKT